MFTQYPDQSKARKGFALTGAILLAFALFMAYLAVWMGFIIFLASAAALLIPTFFWGHTRFVKCEKALSWLSNVSF